MSKREPYLTVSVGTYSLALPGSRIVEVVRYGDAGDVAIADLGRLLGGAKAVVEARTCVVVVSAGARNIGLLVDGATDVVDYAPADLIDPPDFGPGVNLAYLAALARGDRGFVIVVDLDDVLARVEAESRCA